MHIRNSCFFSFLLLSGATLSQAQTIPAPPAVPAAQPAAAGATTEVPARKTLLKVGLNAGRALMNRGPYGISAKLPVTVGAEYLLNSRFTVYGQADTDFNLFGRERDFYSQSRLVSGGAISLGVRYYGNQVHKPFEGYYLGAEVHTELLPGFAFLGRANPALNVICGVQRRLGENFLFDLNAGVGIGANRFTEIYYPSPYAKPSPLSITTQLNLGIYFGH